MSLVPCAFYSIPLCPERQKFIVFLFFQVSWDILPSWSHGFCTMSWLRNTSGMRRMPRNSQSFSCRCWYSTQNKGPLQPNLSNKPFWIWANIAFWLFIHQSGTGVTSSRLYLRYAWSNKEKFGLVAAFMVFDEFLSIQCYFQTFMQNWLLVVVNELIELSHHVRPLTSCMFCKQVDFSGAFEYSTVKQ